MVQGFDSLGRHGMLWKLKVKMSQSVGSKEKSEGKGETVTGRRTQGKGKMEEEFNQCVFIHYFLLHRRYFIQQRRTRSFFITSVNSFHPAVK